MLRMYVAAHSVEHKDLAAAWGAHPSMVTRLLRHGKAPNARVMLRLWAWLLEKEPK